MPISLPNTTVADNYPAPGGAGAQVRGTDIFWNGYFVVANHAVIAQYFYGIQGTDKPSPEFFLAPGNYPVQGTIANPLNGIRFKNAVAGQAGQVFGAFFYRDDPSIQLSSEFLSTVAAGGGITPPGSSLNIQATQAGNKAPGSNYTITCNVTGTYIVEWGCSGYNSGALGDNGSISCSVSGQVNFHATTAGSGGDALDSPIALLATQVITFTVGGTCNALNGCWAKLTQIA